MVTGLQRSAARIVPVLMLTLAACTESHRSSAAATPGKATSTAVPCPSATAPSPTTSPTAAPALGAVTPTVNAAALAHHGRLAFVSQGRLWVLDGDHAALRGLPTVTGRVPQDPSFSADGMWLSFLEATPIPDPEARSSGSLWMARADGSSPHEVTALSDVQAVGWSPGSDVFAALTGPASSGIPCGGPTAVQLISPDGFVRPLMNAGSIAGAAWSPDGTQMAVSIEDADRPGRTTLETYRLSGGSPSVWLSSSSPANVGIMQPAAWWPIWNIGFWVFGGGMVHNNDQTPLDIVASPGGRPERLGDTLSDGTTVAFAAASNGFLAIVNASAVSDAGRVYWQGKQVEVCEPASRICTPVPTPTGTVTVDPSWAPGGTTLAFVRAPERTRSSFEQSAVAGWYGAHQLWLYGLADRSLHEVGAAAGATAPTWSSDGKSLLYVADDGLWLLTSLTAPPVEVAKPLFPADAWPSYYGQVDWSGQFAWSSVP